MKTDDLREEIQRKYREVLSSPDAEFHLHLGPEAAERAGYDGSWLGSSAPAGASRSRTSA